MTAFPGAALFQAAVLRTSSSPNLSRGPGGVTGWGGGAQRPGQFIFALPPRASHLRRETTSPLFFAFQILHFLRVLLGFRARLQAHTLQEPTGHSRVSGGGRRRQQLPFLSPYSQTLAPGSFVPATGLPLTLSKVVWRGP